MKIAIRRRVALVLIGLFGAIGGPASADSLTFISTQLSPPEETQKMRDLILKDFPQRVDYAIEQPWRLPARIEAALRGTAPAIDVVGALHGELQPLAALSAFAPLDELALRLPGGGQRDALLLLGKFGTAHQVYIPWMQANYIMVANKKALPYLPDGARIQALTYDQLAAWANAIQQQTGRRALGFPAGPQGLMHRFFEGFLYPSYTGGVVVPFRSPSAEAMWTQFQSLWRSVDPESTNYNFMQQPLLSGEIWIGFDHVSRVLGALRQTPDEFVAFPAPAGPKGRGHMPVLAGLAVLKNSRNSNGATALIEYLRQPQVQIATARSVGFFPVLKAALPEDIEPGLRMAADAIEKTRSADALVALPPIGLGQRDVEFDNVYRDAFRRIVLQGENARMVLDRQAELLQRIISETGARCWRPDPPSNNACQVQ